MASNPLQFRVEPPKIEQKKERKKEILPFCLPTNCHFTLLLFLRDRPKTYENSIRYHWDAWDCKRVSPLEQICLLQYCIVIQISCVATEGTRAGVSYRTSNSISSNSLFMVEILATVVVLVFLKMTSLGC